MPRPRKTQPQPEIADTKLPGMPDLEPDPEPTTRTRAPRATKRSPLKGAGGRITSASALKAQVTTELYGIASLLVGMWGLADPCAEVLADKVQLPGLGQVERLEAIVMQSVEILARNEKVLQGLAGAGLIGQAGLLAGLLGPVVKTVWKAHGPNGHGHGPVDAEQVDYGRYSAPALA